MARRRYLIGYDITDEKRLRHVCKIMKDYGVRIQYSVFLCDLSRQEFARWKREIWDKVNMAQDSVIHIDLGPLGSCSTIETIGVSRNMPSAGPTII